MRKRIVLLSLLLLVMTFSIGIHQAIAVQTNSQNSTKFESPLGKIQEAARKASKKEADRKVPVDEDSIEELTDTILNSVSLGYIQIPIDIKGSLKSRLFRAEVEFRRGKHKKINETDLVRAFNSLVETFALPEYVKTTRTQVRVLRVDMMASAPSLIGTANRGQGQAASRKAGVSMPNDMSPAEVACLVIVLAQQKLFNPLYQTTSKEWGETFRQWRKSHYNQIAEDQGKMVALPGNTKSEEIKGRLLTKGKSLGIVKTSDLINAFLDDLGIAR